jgi:twitching motility protein PilT
VLSTLHTTDAVKTVERLIGMFPKSQEHIIRMRLAGAFRFIVSQRLIPKADGRGRVAAIEILKSTARTRDYVEKGERDGKSLYDAMRDGNLEGMQVFDGELERMIRAGIITMSEGLAYSSNRQNLLLQLSDLGGGSLEEMSGMESQRNEFVA